MHVFAAGFLSSISLIAATVTVTVALAFSPARADEKQPYDWLSLCGGTVHTCEKRANSSGLRASRVVARFWLGMAYRRGSSGLQQDFYKAKTWLESAALPPYDFRDAQYELGVMYQMGHGVPEDHVTAVKWFYTAATQGHPIAQMLLGIAYLQGDGIPQDWLEAYIWLNLGTAQGGNQSFRDEAARLLTPAQLAKGQHLTRVRLKRIVEQWK